MKEKFFIRKMINNLLKSKNVKFIILMFSILLSTLSKNMDVFASSEFDEEININNNYSKETFLILSITDISFDCFEMYSNLKGLTIVFDTEDNSKISELKNLGKLPNLEYLSLKTNNNLSLSYEDSSFFKDIISLKFLDIEGFSIEEGFLESLTNLEELSLSVFDKNHNNIDTDYSKLTFLKTLNFKDSGPYNIAIWFNLEDYEVLSVNGVSIVSDIDGCLEKVLEINKRLDRVIEDLAIEEDATEYEKFNVIMLYVLNNLEYDKIISSINEKNNKDNKKLAKGFYSDGFLFGSLEKDSAICGNYAALFTALSSRVDLKSNILCNSRHAWNMVQINGLNYYTDLTILDNNNINILYKGIFKDYFYDVTSVYAIENDLTDYLYWDLVNPMSDDARDVFHIPNNLPSYIDLNSITNAIKNNDYCFLSEITTSDMDNIFFGTGLPLILFLEILFILKYKKQIKNITDENTSETTKNKIKKYSKYNEIQ